MEHSLWEIVWSINKGELVMIDIRTERKHHIKDSRIFYIQEGSEKYASYIEASDSTKYLPNWVKLSDLITWPPFRHKGYASALLDAAYQYALNQNKGVYLFVEIDNENAISLYKKKGFDIVMPYSVRRFYQSQDYFHFYIMAKNKSGNYQDLYNHFYGLQMRENPDSGIIEIAFLYSFE